MATPTGTVERRLVRLSGAAALTIVGTIVGLIVAQRVFVAAHRPLSWAAACVVAAVLIDPVVDRLALKIRRVPAVLLTFVVIGAVAVGTTYLVFDEVERALNRLEEAAPDAAAAIQDRDDRVGELAADFELEERVTSSVRALDDRVTGGGDVLRSTAGTLPTYLVCTILTVFLMTYGPRMAKAALDQDPDEDRRRRIAEVVGPAVKRARSAVIFTVGESLLVGLGVAGVAVVLDLPAPSAVGFAAGVLALFPHVGLTIGTIPLLLLALGFRSLPTALGAPGGGAGPPGGRLAGRTPAPGGRLGGDRPGRPVGRGAGRVHDLRRGRRGLRRGLRHLRAGGPRPPRPRERGAHGVSRPAGERSRAI